MGLELLQKVNDFCLFVPDIERSIEFYQNKLNLTIKRKQPGYVEFKFHGTSITLWQKSGVYRAIPDRFLGENGHHFMIAIRVPTFQDVDDLYNELCSKEVEFISVPETYPWEARAAYFKDIDGNIWEIFAWVGAEEPGLVDS